MKIKNLFLLLFFVFIPNIAIANQTVTVDAKYNCCLMKNYKQCAIKINLSPGNYVFKPVNGAMSRWRDNYTAYAQNKLPWEWQVWIKVESDNRPWSLGSLERYESKKEAFQSQKNKRVNINLQQESTVFIWTKDKVCKDNRGELILKILKVD